MKYMQYTLKCLKCGKVYPSSCKAQVCECGGLLEVIYAEKAPRISSTGRFWDYEKVLPNCKYRHYEIGSTRLIRSHEDGSIFLKLEIDNPTRSFKDRGSIVEVSKALEYGKKEMALASTGNMAYSVAHYAKIAGLHVKAFISVGANRDKIKDIRGEGDASMDFVNGDFTKAQKLAVRYAQKSGAFLSGDYCYRKEGQKTVAYEIIDQLPGVTHIIVPVGNATLFSGMFKGLKEMKATGRIKRIPRLVAVQAESSKPLVTAFSSKKEIAYVEPRTAADAISVGFPTFGDQALEALKETGGVAIAVSDKEMEREQKAFYETYGLIAELAGVAGVAASRKLNFGRKDKVVIIISGGNV